MNQTAIFPVVVFLAASLSFLIQPVAGKLLTPQYGGSSAVWCVCLLFFQISLLGGYGLAVILNRLGLSRQLIATTLLFSASIFAVRIPVNATEWTPLSLDDPIISLLIMMTSRLLVPCIALYATGLLIQDWSRLLNSTPYWLYSVSNVGSISALLAYPVLIEPFVSASVTIRIWQGMFVVLGLLVMAAGIIVLRNPNVHPRRLSTEPVSRPNTNDYLRWISLSFAGSALLVSTTSMITADIAPVPMLWIPVLVTYLLTFVFTFSQRPFYNRTRYVLAAQALLLINVGLPAGFIESFPILGISNALGLLFVLCMICHGELTTRKPEPKFLARYYLATGGVLGGIAINLLVPLILKNTIEHTLILSLLGCWTVHLMVGSRVPFLRRSALKNAYAAIMVIFLLVPSVRLLASDESIIHSERNFYNATRVVRNNLVDAIGLYSGRTIHGFQLKDPSKSQIPTAYYSTDSAIGILNVSIRNKHSGQPLKFGAIGLGTGTIAAYGQSGDTVVFYEIDPKIKSIAERYFTFVRQSSARVEIRLGDARQTLSREAPQGYDLLVVDAFSGDSVPHHLLTKEAMRLYLRHINPRGVLAFHVTNHYLDLASVVNNVALSLNLPAFMVHTVKGGNPYGAESRYIVVTRAAENESLRLSDFSKNHRNVTIGTIAWNSKVGLWTDDYVNLFSVLDIM